MNRIFPVYIVIFLFLLNSCTTRTKTSELNYMQDIEQLAIENASNYQTPVLQTGDQLVILVTAKNMEVVKPFNQNYSSASSEFSKASGNAPTQNQTLTSGPTYTVDQHGEIDFPVIGKVQVAGKTVTQLQDDLRAELKRYVIDPSVNIRLTNYKITVLGEVKMPGQYIVPDAQATILNVLGLAGDLTIYGKRNDVLLIRNENGQIIKHKIDLLQSDFINSPYFFLKQGDVLYVSANETKERTAKLNPNTGTYIAIAGTLIGLAGIFITIFKN